MELRIPLVPILPTAESARQGQIVRLRGGDGSPGKVFICVGDGAGVHAWVDVSTAPAIADVTGLQTDLNNRPGKTAANAVTFFYMEGLDGSKWRVFMNGNGTFNVVTG